MLLGLLKWVCRWISNGGADWLFNSNAIEDNKQKRERIPTSTRDAVWHKYHGTKDSGKCYSCGIAVNRYNAGWHCSHVKSDTKGGNNTIDNLRVCCAGCNLSMGDQNMYAYIRDKKLKGPGARNVNSYMKAHYQESYDKRGNNWTKK
jgi:hypothetical protein